MSQVLGAILKLVFVTQTLTSTGQRFRFMSGKVITFFAKFGFFIQDGGAHKITWHCRGDSGTRFCMLCKNMVSVRSEFADGDGALRAARVR